MWVAEYLRSRFKSASEKGMLSQIMHGNVCACVSLYSARPGDE